jgi:hypothetical protein
VLTHFDRLLYRSPPDYPTVTVENGVTAAPAGAMIRV